jgi:hypothetical protein
MIPAFNWAIADPAYGRTPSPAIGAVVGAEEPSQAPGAVPTPGG